MNRTAVAAITGAVALLLASCSSSSGTAVAGSSSSSAAAVSSASASSTSASSTPASSAPLASAPESSAAVSTGPASSAVESTPADSSAVGSSPAESSTSQSSAPASSAPVSSSTASGSLDAPTTAWFGAFCGGLTPFFGSLKQAQTKEKGIAQTDYAAQKALFVGLLRTGGTQLSGTGTKLKALPGPTFGEGSAFATKTVDVLGKAGPAFTAAAKKLAAASATKASVAAAAVTLTDQVKGVAGQISAVGVLDVPDSTKRELLELPACTKLQSTVQG